MCDEVQRTNYRLDKRGTSGHMHRKTRKIMKQNRCLHPRSSVARLYMKQKGGRGLINVEDCITNERRGLYDYLNERKEDMLSVSLKENVIVEGETKEEFTKRRTDDIKKTLHEGKLQGQFVEKTRNIARKFSRKWIRNGFLKKETESMIVICSSGAGTKNHFNQNNQFLPNVDCVGQGKRQLCL